jgi:hypothetical protein
MTGALQIFLLEELNNFIDFHGKTSKIRIELEKGKPPEKAARKVTGLSL